MTERKRYVYDGPVLDSNMKVRRDRFRASTLAFSKAQAKIHFIIQYRNIVKQNCFVKLKNDCIKEINICENVS